MGIKDAQRPTLVPQMQNPVLEQAKNTKENAINKNRGCSVVGCLRSVRCRGVCTKHYHHLSDVKLRETEHRNRVKHLPEKLIRGREYSRAYAKRPEVKARRKIYEKRPDVAVKKKAYRKDYYSRPEVILRQQEYNSHPEVIARKHAQYLLKYVPHPKQLLAPEEKRRRTNAHRRERYKDEKVKERKKHEREIYLSKPGIRKKQREYHKMHSQLPERKAYRKSYQQKRRENDPQFSLVTTLRCRLIKVLKTYAGGKQRHANEYGIDYEAIFAKIGSRPSKEYDIEHIIPTSAFDLTKSDEVAKCFSPENLRWCLRESNIKKSNYWLNGGKFFKGKNEIAAQNVPNEIKKMLVDAVEVEVVNRKSLPNKNYNETEGI